MIDQVIKVRCIITCSHSLIIPVLIVEFIPGGTLEDLLHTSTQPLSFVYKLMLGIDIASAMVSFTYSINITHSWIPLSNVCVRVY